LNDDDDDDDGPSFGRITPRNYGVCWRRFTGDYSIHLHGSKARQMVKLVLDITIAGQEVTYLIGHSEHISCQASKNE
jgi:hypothetical protein